MVHKRSFGVEETYEFPCKHQRQLDYSNQLGSVAEIAPCNGVPQSSLSSVDGGGFSKSQGFERVSNATVHANGDGKEVDANIPAGISSFSCVINSTSEEDSTSAGKLLFSPGVLEAGCSTRRSSQHDQMYSALSDSPQELVPVGLDHQAIIPQCAGSEVMAYNENMEKSMGTCVLSMPDSEALCCNDDVGNGRSDNCKLSDKGAFRCVQQLIFEATDKLRDFLGQEKFLKLGLHEMGEIVATKWTEEEEKLFQSIVFAHTASSGKNFWAQLSEGFPSRSTMDLVSYYFNVFMLRRRAEQNSLGYMKIAHCNEIPQKPYSLVGESGDFSRSQDIERVRNVIEPVDRANKELETNIPLSWVNSSTSEEDSRSEAAVKLLFSPDVFEAGCSTRTLVQHDEIYSFLLDSPPRKLVPVGSDHQAIIPFCSGPNAVLDNDNWEKLMGTRLLPMPDSEEAVAQIRDDVGKGRPDNCKCSDRGSVRCVQYHIFEAREKLRDSLGPEKFMELGFYEMGESVARKWTEKEQQIFQNIVFLNPASYSKNFWTQLHEVFPSRSKMDLVSYYFNVFMIRRRAEQNRSDRMNIDSDNDEWQMNVDEQDYEISDEEEEEDSVVESEGDQEKDTHDNNGNIDNDNNNAVRDGWQEEDEEVDNGGIDNYVSEAGLDPTTIELENKNLKRDRIGSVDNQNGQQDDSCTSDECHPNAADCNKQNVGYVENSKPPTTNMIEEGSLE